MNKKQKTENIKHTDQKIERPQETDWKEKYLRALADYQNLEKRTDDRIQRTLRAAHEPLLLSLLEIVDDIEKAEAFIQDPGLRLIQTKLNKLLVDQDVKEIEVQGKMFDPNLAEALNVVDGEDEGMVVDVLRKGYWQGDRVLRPAGVVVSKKEIRVNSL